MSADRQSDTQRLPAPRVTPIRNNADDPPAWFSAWLESDFHPFRDSITKRVSTQDRLLSVAKYIGVGAATVLVARFPELAGVVKALFGGG